ncbi:pectate lyase family protein [Ensifer sp. 4252]|uniref:pectate lyase family protein n=1 Tax=Ensifer sp. 4252 TaxID=3373915 RepID=UPI003D197231
MTDTAKAISSLNCLFFRQPPARWGRAVAVACLALTSSAGLSLAQDQPAFPGAEGYGKMASGGRGGAIIPVTNLNNAGPGSLRACIDLSGPRNCVFRIGGTIKLKSTLVVRDQNANLSILGQTAPGGGILLTIDQTNSEGLHTPFVVKGSVNVIIRHLRMRPQFANSIPNVDGVTIENSRLVYVDHVSTSWATDENFNAYATTTDLTVANSIFAEGLNKHSKCALLGSDPRGPQNISFWRNACVSNRDRNPDDNHYGGSCIEIVNNIFFNAGSEWGEIFSQFPGGTPISYVGNYFKAGPSTNEVTYAMNWNDIASVDNPKLYQSGNVTWSFGKKSIVAIAPDTLGFVVDKPPCPLAIANPEPAETIYAVVTATAGAFPRDGVDTRVIAEIGPIGQKGGGKMVRAPGALPQIAIGEPYLDSDSDGMADAVEPQFGAAAAHNDPWLDGDGNGWSNFDDFMQWLSEERIAGRYPTD